MNVAEQLAEAARSGELTLESALEEFLGGKCSVSEAAVSRTLALHNMGFHDRPVDPDNETLTVAEFVKQFELEAFLLLLDRHEEAEYQLGELVIYEGQCYQVIGRRAASPFTLPGTSEYELLIEALDDSSFGIVSEGDLEPMEEDE